MSLQSLESLRSLSAPARRHCGVYFPTMAPRFDPESLRLDLSVADLLESPFLRSLGFSSRGGYERLWLGQAIHGRYQEQKLEEDLQKQIDAIERAHAQDLNQKFAPRKKR